MQTASCEQKAATSSSSVRLNESPDSLLISWITAITSSRLRRTHVFRGWVDGWVGGWVVRTVRGWVSGWWDARLAPPLRGCALDVATPSHAVGSGGVSGFERSTPCGWAGWGGARVLDWVAEDGLCSGAGCAAGRAHEFWIG